MQSEGKRGISTPDLNHIRCRKTAAIPCALGDDALLDWAVHPPWRSPGYGGLKS